MIADIAGTSPAVTVESERTNLPMCMACQEMEIYYAYLDALEAEKRKAQPWQCEVTLFPAEDEAGRSASESAPAAAETASNPAATKPAPRRRAKAATFACDTPE
jgi:hypothetical protein